MEDVRLSRSQKMGLLGAISYIIGNIVGSGIFITPSTILKTTGSMGLSLIIWVTAACISMLGSFCYVELGTSIRMSGGDFAYLCFMKCAERASKPRTPNLDRISKTTKELLEKKSLRLTPNESHIERLIAITSCGKPLQEEHNIQLVALLSKDGTRMSSRREMEIITGRFYSNLFRSSTPVSTPIIPSGVAPDSQILPSEVRTTVKSMKPGTAPGPNFISADFLRAVDIHFM
ncbi:hypothetical protein RB195_018344 [Necator americanus]|uniref:Amino acid permease/ SLC12A domain-containing protein n=1 Tax=Necator americanus TaxID=51031 RepID=A0ABR1C9C3_NECAM